MADEEIYGDNFDIKFKKIIYFSIFRMDFDILSFLFQSWKHLRRVNIFLKYLFGKEAEILFYFES